MSRFFIDRPIFAWVIAIVIMLAGLLSIKALPIAQYPAIAPPAISITGNYPGASAQTVEDSITQVIEQKMNGIDGLRYMASNSDSSGAVNITLTFENGTSILRAAVPLPCRVISDAVHLRRNLAERSHCRHRLRRQFEIQRDENSHDSSVA